MKKALILLALLAVILPAGVVLADIAFENTKVTTHAFGGPIDEIVVRSDNGDVELVPSRGRGVEVRETQHYLFRQPTLDRDVDNGVLTLEVTCRAAFVTCFSSLRVSVPAGATVRVDADSGDIDARRVDVAAAQLQSDSGDMRVELLGRQRLVRAHADSGDLEITARGARAIDMQTDSGDVEVGARDALQVEAQTDSGDVTVATSAITRRIVAGADSGDLRVSVPRRGEYAVSTKTDSGDVKVDGILRNDRAERSIEAHTDSGDVTLNGG